MEYDDNPPDVVDGSYSSHIPRAAIKNAQSSGGILGTNHRASKEDYRSEPSKSKIKMWMFLVAAFVLAVGRYTAMLLK